MGGKSKKQTIGYKYYLGMHQILCQGPIDAVTRVTVDDRQAWVGTNNGGAISVNAPDLFGGESREGGVSGTIDIEMGSPTQGQNSYLLSKLGALIPAYRGVVGAVFRQCYLGNNPYLKPWRFRGQRVYVRQDGIAQWYPAKAGITGFGGASTVAKPVVLSWWQSAWHASQNDHARMRLTFHNNAGTVIGSISGAMDGVPDHVWTQRTVNGTQPVGTAYLTLYIEMDRVEGASNDGFIDDISLTIGGQPVAVYNPGAEDGLSGWTTEIGALTLRSSDPPPHSGDAYFYGGLGVTYTSASQQIGLGQLDMNGVHMIRECLTDPDWGMGYTDGDIDATSFTAAADTIFAEKMGISLLWDRQIKIEEFVDEVKKHIDAAVYVSRDTGKFVIKLIRNDYDPEDLLLLDESNIARVEDPSRSSFGELVNSVTVQYWDANTGKDASLTVTDTAMVQTQGAVINTTVQYPGFTNARNATIAGQRDLKTLSTPGLSCTIYADSDAKDLNIGDAFKFSWAKWGLVEVVMRVANIAYGTGRNNQVRIECTQDTFDTNTAVVISVPDNDWEDPSSPPSASDDQLAVEAPYFELVQALGQSDIDASLTTKPEIGYVIAAASRAASAINARLWTDDGTGFEQVGTLDFAPTAVLVANITKTQTAFTVTGMEDVDEVTLGTHVQVGNELMRIDTIDLVTGAMTVGRGVLDTVPEAHVAGDMLFFWDAYAGFDPTEYVAGEEVDVKITPVSGAGVLPIGDAIPMTVTLAQRPFRPYAPGDLQINGDSYEDNFYQDELTITWTHRDRLQQTAGVLIDHTAGDIGPEAGTVYRVQGYVDGVLVYTEDDIAGTTATWTPGEEGVVKVEVHAKRDELYSWQGPSHEFYYTGGDALLTEEGDERRTEEGILRVTED